MTEEEMKVLTTVVRDDLADMMSGYGRGQYRLWCAALLSERDDLKQANDLLTAVAERAAAERDALRAERDQAIDGECERAIERDAARAELAELALAIGYGERPEGQGHIIHMSGPELAKRWLSDRQHLEAARAESETLRASCAMLRDRMVGVVEMLRRPKNQHSNSEAAATILDTTAKELSVDVSAWLESKLSEARREQAETDFDGLIDILGDPDHFAPAPPERLLVAVNAYGARVRVAAMEEAADLAEDWTCKRCDSDTAADLAMAIRAIDRPGVKPTLATPKGGETP